MILKIDTTKRDEVTISLFDQKTKKTDKIVAKQFGSQLLLPAIIKILKKNRKGLTDIDQVEVETGPGSFTGTRVGVSVANALGFALDIPVNSQKGKIALPIYQKSKFDRK